MEKREKCKTYIRWNDEKDSIPFCAPFKVEFSFAIQGNSGGVKLMKKAIDKALGLMYNNLCVVRW